MREEENGLSTFNDGVAMSKLYGLVRVLFIGREYSCAMVRVPVKIFMLVAVLYAVAGSAATANAQDIWPRHYPPYNGANPRPDLLPRGLYNAWVPYRKAYNRPTYVGGLLAHTIEPSSQEAMSWEENHANGYYHTHCPTPIRLYYYPKPWEVLNTGVRPSGENLNDQFRPQQEVNDLIPENPDPAVQRY